MAESAEHTETVVISRIEGDEAWATVTLQSVYEKVSGFSGEHRGTFTIRTSDLRPGMSNPWGGAQVGDRIRLRLSRDTRPHSDT
jgi:hypothetical protein